MSPCAQRLLAAAVSAALVSGCGQAPTQANPPPTSGPVATRPSTVAYAETDVPGTLRVFDVDDRTGALSVKNEVTPGGLDAAPVVSPGSFAVDPNGRFLYYSYDSCRAGWCGNVSSYEILPDGGLRLTGSDGPLSLEGGIEVLFATAKGPVTHWNDAPAHLLAFYSSDSSGRLTADAGIGLGLGYSNVPSPFELTRNGRWGYGLTTRGLISYGLETRPWIVATQAHSLPAGGRGLEMDPAERLLYVSLQTTPPRIDVYGIGDSGLGRAVGSTRVGEAGSLLIEPNGFLLFLGTSAGIETYGVDPRTGLLTPRGQERITELESLAVHPSGTFLYACLKDTSIRAYAIDLISGALRDTGLVAQGRRLQLARSAAATGGA